MPKREHYCRVFVTVGCVKLWLSAETTAAWSRGEYGDHGAWPGSAIGGYSLRAEWDKNGLVEYAIGGTGWRARIVSNLHEFNAITADFLRANLPPDHALYQVTVGQFDHEVKPS